MATYEVTLTDADEASLWDFIKNEAVPGPPDAHGRRSPVPKYNGVGDFIADVVGQNVSARLGQKPTVQMQQLLQEIEDRQRQLNTVGRPQVRKKGAP